MSTDREGVRAPMPPLHFEDTGEVRTPKLGEWFVASDGSITFQNDDRGWALASYDHRRILRPVSLGATEAPRTDALRALRDELPPTLRGIGEHALSVAEDESPNARWTTDPGFRTTMQSYGRVLGNCAAEVAENMIDAALAAPAAPGATPPTGPCEHPDFSANVAVNRLSDTGRFSADVRVACKACGAAFRFLGLPAGIDLNGAAVSVDGTEARLAIAPPGEVRTALDGEPLGFTVRAGAPGATDARLREAAMRMRDALAGIDLQSGEEWTRVAEAESELTKALRPWSAPVASAGTTRGAGLAVDASADGVGTKSDQPAPAARQPEADATPAPAPDPLWEFLESHLGLHTGVELVYVVDGYEVTLTGRDGRITLASGRGETLRDAVAAARQAFGPEVPDPGAHLGSGR